MTAVAERAAAPAAPRTGGTRLARVVGAALLPLGPLAVGVVRYVIPYDTADDAGAVAAGVASDPGAQGLVVWLTLVAALTLLPGVLAICGLTRAASPRLTAAALVLAGGGYLAFPLMAGADVVAWTATDAGLGTESVAALWGAMHPAVTVATAIFVVGHVVGTVLLGIALWRARAVHPVAAAALTVSQPLHAVAAVVLANHALDLAAWSLTALAMAAVAVAVVRRAEA